MKHNVNIFLSLVCFCSGFFFAMSFVLSDPLIIHNYDNNTSNHVMQNLGNMYINLCMLSYCKYVYNFRYHT